VLRKKENQGYEIRIQEVAGLKGAASIAVNVPARGAAETDLQGKKVREAKFSSGKLSFDLDPWRVRTFETM